MAAHVQVFRRRRWRATRTAMWPASEKRQGTKSRWVEHRRCHKLYGDLTCLGLDREHNFSDLARALLIGESNFRLACDFKELRVANSTHFNFCVIWLVQAF